MPDSYLKFIISEYKAKLAGKWPAEISELRKETSVLSEFDQFLTSHINCFSRQNQFGHITGSAMVLSPDGSEIVMTLHKKLGKWLQLGGHSDENPLTFVVSLNEVKEESGLESLELLCPTNPKQYVLPDRVLPLDLNVHLIPARPNEPEHFHFDVVYLMRSSEKKLKISDESDDLRWIKIENIQSITDEVCTLRQIEKIKWLKNKFNM
jgi:hypothetical protein